MQITKRKRGIYGPAQSKKLLMFIDDLNMPKKEQYGAQPPIELLRQFLDYQSWYVWELNKEYTKIEDMVLFGCMGRPGGGRAVLTARFMRHFNVLAYVDLSKDVIKNVYGTIMDLYLEKFN